MRGKEEGGKDAGGLLVNEAYEIIFKPISLSPKNTLSEVSFFLFIYLFPYTFPYIFLRVLVMKEK